MNTPAKHQTEQKNRTETARNAHDFGAVDKRGRAIGAITVCGEVDFVPVDTSQGSYSSWNIAPGHYFSLTVHATRDGVRFGAYQHPNYFATAAERDAAVVKYLAAARKRAAKIDK